VKIIYKKTFLRNGYFLMKNFYFEKIMILNETKNLYLRKK